MKKKWFKNLQTGDVYYREGFTKSGAMVIRDRDRKLTLVEAPWFNYSPIEATGFPPLKPKFKPRYAVYHLWEQGEAFVKEYEPGKFKVVMKDGSEKEPTGAWRFFEKFFDDGSWYVVPEEEALARLDKPKKILVEWAVSLGAEGPYLYELYPDWKTLTLPGSFKTGRTVEVPQ